MTEPSQIIYKSVHAWLQGTENKTEFGHTERVRFKRELGFSPDIITLSFLAISAITFFSVMGICYLPPLERKISFIISGSSAGVAGLTYLFVKYYKYELQPLSEEMVKRLKRKYEAFKHIHLYKQRPSSTTQESTFDDEEEDTPSLQEFLRRRGT